MYALEEKGESRKGLTTDEQVDRIGSAEKEMQRSWSSPQPDERGERMRDERADAPRRSERPPSKDWCDEKHAPTAIAEDLASDR